MKKIIIVLLLLLSTEAKSQSIFTQSEIDSLNKLKVGSDRKPTSYKAGFVYYDGQGIKTTLLKWVNTGKWLGVNEYRWRTRLDVGGLSVLAWTDDCWIDVYTGKA